MGSRRLGAKSVAGPACVHMGGKRHNAKSAVVLVFVFIADGLSAKSVVGLVYVHMGG